MDDEDEIETPRRAMSRRLAAEAMRAAAELLGRAAEEAEDDRVIEAASACERARLQMSVAEAHLDLAAEMAGGWDWQRSGGRLIAAYGGASRNVMLSVGPTAEGRCPWSVSVAGGETLSSDVAESEDEAVAQAEAHAVAHG